MAPSNTHSQDCPMCGQPVPTIICPDCGDEVMVNRLGIIRTHPHSGPRCSGSGALAPVPDALDPRVLATEAVTFGLDGKNYTLKLSAANARRLRDAIKPYAAAGRRKEPPHGNSAAFLLARERQQRRDGRDRAWIDEVG